MNTRLIIITAFALIGVAFVCFGNDAGFLLVGMSSALIYTYGDYLQAKHIGSEPAREEMLKDISLALTGWINADRKPFPAAIRSLREQARESDNELSACATFASGIGLNDDFNEKEHRHAVVAVRRLALAAERLMQERNAYKQSVDKAHAVIDMFGVLPPRATSHDGLPERISEIIYQLVTERSRANDAAAQLNAAESRAARLINAATKGGAL